MKRTTAFSALLALLTAGPARAAEEDTQLWLTGAVAMPLSADLNGNLEVSQRFREGDDQWLVRGNVDLKLSRPVSLGAGATHAEAGGTEEFRLHQQLTLTAGPVAFRTRVEERFFEGADRMQLRVRQRAQVTLPVDAETRAALSGELFYIARSHVAGAGDRLEQWRLNATLTRRLSGRLEGTVGYLFIATPRPGAPDRVSHVPQLTLTVRL